MADQLVYYGIYTEVKRKAKQHRSLNALYGYSRVDDVSDRARAVNTSFDPIEILPPELSLRCLFDALHSGPDDGLYQSELLQMLNVSKKWCHYIISSPLLWSEIYIDHSTPDLLAMLATFAHLSSTAPLKVDILGDPGTSWNEIGDILLPHSRRIRSLSFKCISNSRSRTETQAHISSAKRILSSFNCLSGLKELDFSILMDLYSVDVDFPTIPRHVLIKNVLNIPVVKTGSAVVSRENYARVITLHRLEDIIPLLGSVSIRELTLHRDPVAQTSESNIAIPLDAVPHLTVLRCHQSSCIFLGRLFMLTAHQLSHLELALSFWEVQEIIDTLSILVKLKYLELRLATGLKKRLERRTLRVAPLSMISAHYGYEVLRSNFTYFLRHS